MNFETTHTITTTNPAIVNGTGNILELAIVLFSVSVAFFTVESIQVVPFEVKFAGHVVTQLPKYTKYGELHPKQ